MAGGVLAGGQRDWAFVVSADAVLVLLGVLAGGQAATVVVREA